jgi:hypothetical protein
LTVPVDIVANPIARQVGLGKGHRDKRDVKAQRSEQRHADAEDRKPFVRAEECKDDQHGPAFIEDIEVHERADENERHQPK